MKTNISLRYIFFFLLPRHMSMTANQILEQLKSAFSCDERLWHPTYLKVFWYRNVYIVLLFFLALNHLKQHPFNVLIAVKCLKTFYDHLILHQTVIRNRKLGVWGSFSESAMWSVLYTMVRGWDQSKYVYNEMPDFTLGVLQDRFDKKSLEDLYKKYEQRYQLSESFFFLFDAGFTLSLFR